MQDLKNCDKLQSFFINNYPTLHELYCNYINTDEYAKHPVVKFLNNCHVEDEVISYLANGEENKAVDAIIVALIDAEAAGFILGYSFATSIFNEIKKDA